MTSIVLHLLIDILADVVMDLVLDDDRSDMVGKKFDTRLTLPVVADRRCNAIGVVVRG
jgi:hypothetical protein